MKKRMPDHAAMLRKGRPLAKKRAVFARARSQRIAAVDGLALKETPCLRRCPELQNRCTSSTKGSPASERSAPCKEDQDLRAALNSDCPANRGFPRASFSPRLRKPTQSLSPTAPTSARLRTSVESQLAAGSHENPCSRSLATQPCSMPNESSHKKTGATQKRPRPSWQKLSDSQQPVSSRSPPTHCALRESRTESKSSATA